MDIYFRKCLTNQNNNLLIDLAKVQLLVFNITMISKEQLENNKDFILTERQKQLLNRMLPKRFCLVAVEQTKQRKVSVQHKQKQVLSQTSTDVIDPLFQQQLFLMNQRARLKNNAFKGNKKNGKNIVWSCEIPHKQQDMKICQLMLKELKKAQSSRDFQMPVDPMETGVPHYYEMIKEPMDLQTISCLLKNDKYQNKEQFYQDIERIISNSRYFNWNNSKLLSITKKFQRQFINLKKILENPTRRKALQLKINKRETKVSKNQKISQLQQRETNIKFITTEFQKIPKIKRKIILSNLFTDKLTIDSCFFDINDLNNLQLIVLKNQLLKDKRKIPIIDDE